MAESTFETRGNGKVVKMVPLDKTMTPWPSHAANPFEYADLPTRVRAEHHPVRHELASPRPHQPSPLANKADKPSRMKPEPLPHDCGAAHAMIAKETEAAYQRMQEETRAYSGKSGAPSPKPSGTPRDTQSHKDALTVPVEAKPRKQIVPVYVIYEIVTEAYQVESHGIVGIYHDLKKANARAALRFKKEHGEFLRGDEAVENVQGFGEPDEIGEDEEDDDFDSGLEYATAEYDPDGCLRIEVEDSGVGCGNQVQLYVQRWLVD